jgi:hypothetical protein
MTQRLEFIYDAAAPPPSAETHVLIWEPAHDLRVWVPKSLAQLHLDLSHLCIETGGDLATDEDVAALMLRGSVRALRSAYAEALLHLWRQGRNLPDPRLITVDRLVRPSDLKGLRREHDDDPRDHDY